MQVGKFQVSKYTRYGQLPLDQLQSRKYSIYVIDYDWNYLYANQHAVTTFGGIDPTGKNIRTVWEENASIKSLFITCYAITLPKKNPLV